MRAQIDCAGHQTLQCLVIERLQMGQRGAELAQRSQVGAREIRQAFQELARRLATRGGIGDAKLLAPRRHHRLRTEVDELSHP